MSMTGRSPLQSLGPALAYDPSPTHRLERVARMLLRYLKVRLLPEYHTKALTNTWDMRRRDAGRRHTFADVTHSHYCHLVRSSQHPCILWQSSPGHLCPSRSSKGCT